MNRHDVAALLVAACLISVVASAETVVRARPEDRAVWVKKIATTHQAVFDAKVAQTKAAADFNRARHDRSVRGGEKAEVMKLRGQADRKLAAAEKGLADLLELARRSGVPPGWIRDGMGTPVNVPPGVVLQPEEPANGEVQN